MDLVAGYSLSPPGRGSVFGVLAACRGLEKKGQTEAEGPPFSS